MKLSVISLTLLLFPLLCGISWSRDTDTEAVMKSAEAFLDSIPHDSCNITAADISMKLAHYYREERFLFSEAIRRAEYAYSVYCATGDIRKKADAQLFLSRLYLKKGIYHKTLTTAGEALKIYRSEKDSAGIMECINVLGELKVENNDFEGAYADFNTYLDWGRRHRDTAVIIKGLNNKALIASYCSENENPAEQLHEAIRLSELTKDSLLYFRASVSLISIMMSNNDTSGTRKCLESITGFRNDIEKTGIYHWMNGWYLTVTGNNMAAIRNLNEAVDDFRQGEFPLQTRSCYYLLAELHYKEGNYMDAFLALKEYCSIYPMINSNRDELIKLFSLQNDIMIEQERLAMESGRLEQKKLMATITLSALAVLIAVISFMIYKNLKLRRKEVKLETMELEKAQKEQQLKVKNDMIEIKRMQQFQSERLIMDIVGKLQRLNLGIKDQQVRDEISLICHNLKHSDDSTGWEETEQFIPEFNSPFFQKLSADYPDLSINQKRLCILLNMNMTTKMISQITRQSPHSIDISRSRLRRKFGLSGKDTSIQEFLSKYN